MTFVLLAASVWHYFFGIFIFLSSVFLILLVLVQRGRGGGLTGALGGMGGQSAFGTKAGDVFTKITVVTAAIWIILCMGAIWVLGSHDEWGGSSDGMSSDTSGDQDGQTGDSTEPAGSGDSGAADAGGGTGTTDSGGTSTPASSGTAAPGDTSEGDGG